MTCKCCESQTRVVFHKTILGKYNVAYHKCVECGFMQTDDPTWLDEAYGSDPVSPFDISSPWRALRNANIVSRIIDDHFDPHSRFLDYGGGTGLFVRLMRDRGDDFLRYDPYCPNIYGKFFDWQDVCGPGDTVTLVTCNEVFEHFVHPRSDFEKLASLTDSILLTTSLQPPTPQLEAWSYLIPECGQHVSFYTETSLKRLAASFGFNVSTDGVTTHFLHRSRPSIDVRDYTSRPTPRRNILERIVRKSVSLLTPSVLERSQIDPPYPPQRDADWVLRKMKALESPPLPNE